MASAPGASGRRMLLAALEPEDLVDEDDDNALGDYLAIDDEDLVHGAVDAVRRLRASILQRQRVVVDPAQSFLEVRHDLLRPHYEDDSHGAAGVRSELAAAHRGRHQRAGLGDRVNAAQHHVRRRGQAADLLGLLGIEATGVVAAAPGGEFDAGQQVAAMMGGMGRTFDGGYAEYT